MKMNKILAAGVAATLAVTSLASVASAEELTFNMANTSGTIKLSAKGFAEFNGDYSLTDEQLEQGATLDAAANDRLIVSDVAGVDGKPVFGQLKSVTLNVTGVKGTRGNSSKTYSYKFTQYNDAACTSQDYSGKVGDYFCLEIKKDKGTADNHFVPGQFVEITKMELVIEGEDYTDNQKTYDAFGSTVWGRDASGLEVSYGWNAGGVADEIANIAYANFYYYGFAEKSTKDSFAFLPVTAPGASTLLRNDVKLLSSADEYSAGGVNQYGESYKEVTITGENGQNITLQVPVEFDYSENQSYYDSGLGKKPVGFAGLASQVGDFFNKQTNGTITFKFTLGTSNGGSNWNNGGVPSTQVGLKDLMSSATAKDFALFFNYTQTGSLQATTLVDQGAGAVTFDISDVLDDLDGKTIGVIDNIFYGMTKGIDYDLDEDGTKESTGLLVEEIVLAYDEDAADDTDIEDDDDDATIDDDDDAVVDDDDDDATIEDDDDDAAVDDDDDADDDTDVDGDVDEPVTPADDDDDANPGTGVALAVVPALVAAAAVVVSKKRK